MSDYLTYWLANPSRATSAVVGLTLVALFFPLALPFSAAMVGLVALRHGLRPSLEVMSYAAITLGLVTWILGGGVTGVLGLVLAYWLPVGLAAGLWQQTGALALALLALTLLAWGVLALLYLILGDPAAWWLAFLEQSPLATNPNFVDLVATLRELAPLFPGQVAISLLVLWLAALIMARASLGPLGRRPAFRVEFRELRLGRLAATVALGVFVGAWFTQAPALLNMSLVLLVVYLFQGLATLHGVAHQRQWSPYLFIPIYLLLPILFAEPLILLGVVDAWADLRRRLAPRP